jgi:hypothetical protein
MKHAIIKKLPKNLKLLFDEALSKSYANWTDEKGTKDNPKTCQRQPSKLSYEKAFEIIKNNKPHWVISFRENSYFGEKDYWEFGGCNISGNDYGEVFIWICVDVKIVEKIFKKFKLEVNEY